MLTSGVGSDAAEPLSALPHQSTNRLEQLLLGRHLDTLSA